MSKIRIYIEKNAIVPSLRIEDRSIIHKIKNVLRLRLGNELYIFDGEGKEYLFKIKDIKNKFVLIEKENLQKEVSFPKKTINLGFPILKEDKTDFILQKATELGVSRFYPFKCSRSIANRPTSSNKLQRWKKIIIEAARQSERLWLPQINEFLDFKDVVKIEFKTKFFGSVDESNLNKVNLKSSNEIFLVIGPTGDFSPQEKVLLRKNNFTPLCLSPNILKAETAAIFGVGLINYFFK